MTKERDLLEKLVKTWAQDHTTDFVVADLNPNEEALIKTSSHFTWIIREGHANANLVSLVDKLEILLLHYTGKRHPDGMFCKKCRIFSAFAEPNQEDGSMICYGCRNV